VKFRPTDDGAGPSASQEVMSTSEPASPRADILGLAICLVQAASGLFTSRTGRRRYWDQIGNRQCVVMIEANDGEAQHGISQSERWPDETTLKLSGASGLFSALSHPAIFRID
jgi:hypothetical protein